ncbi:spore coat protein [Priestia megaterium]|uniref:spore coat protein n=1 Tax=Priestia megaterium TaxID=1404 RepID=UPI003D0838B6
MGSSKKERCRRCSHKCSNHCCCLPSKHSRKKDSLHFNKDNNIDALIRFDENQVITGNQFSDAIVFVKNSCNVDVNLTDRQTIIIFQTFIQLLAIFLLLIGLDTNSIKLFIQEVTQIVKVIQSNSQKVIIKNSSHVNVTATNTDTVIFIQTFLQALAVLLIA